MKKNSAVQKRLIVLSLQATLACAAVVLAPAAEAAAYYEAGARAWSYYLPARDADNVTSTTTGVNASASSVGGNSGAGSSAYASASAGAGYLGAYAYGTATNAVSYAEATSGANFVLSDLVFSSANPSNTQVTTSLNFTIGGNIWGSSSGGSQMHSRGGVGIGWRLRSGGVTYLSADGGLSYWTSETDPGIQLVQASGVLADLSSMPPGYDWSYTSLLTLGGQTTITLNNITLDLGRVYELTAWINSDVQSGLSATAGSQTVLGVDFGHTMSFPTSGAVFNLPEGFTINSADGAIVNNQWIDPRPAVVPIPAAVWLFGSGLVGLAGIARRGKHQRD